MLPPVCATLTIYPILSALTESPRLDCVETGPGNGAEATIFDGLPSTQTTQVANLTAANLARLSAPRATASEIIDQREVALVSGNEFYNRPNGKMTVHTTLNLCLGDVVDTTLNSNFEDFAR